MHYRQSTPFPTYPEWSPGPPQPRRARPARPAARRHATQQHADMRAVFDHWYPNQLGYRNAPARQQMADERVYAQHMEATVAAHHAAYQQLALARALQEVQPPEAHQSALTRTEASRLQSQERPAHNKDPPKAHQASTLQKMTYQQLADTGRMNTTHQTHNNHVPTTQMEVFHQHMHMERMRASQMSDIHRQNATHQNLHPAHSAIPLPAVNTQRDYQQQEPTYRRYTPYPSLPQQAHTTQSVDRARRNHSVNPGTIHRPDLTSAEMRAQPVPSGYQQYADQSATSQAIYGNRASEQRADHHQNTQWPPYASRAPNQSKEDVLGAAHVTYQPSTDTFATAHVAYQPNTHMYTKSEIIFQPRTNMVAAKQLVYQPGTDMIATAETVYQGGTNMMSTRQTMIQPQEDMIRTKEAVYQPNVNVLATRETNIQYRKNVVNTTQTIYQSRADINVDNHMNSSPTARKQQKQTKNSEKTVQVTQKTAPILRQILSVEQNQDELHTPSEVLSGIKDTSEQNHQGDATEVQPKTPTRQRKSATPKKTLRQTRKRKLSTESESIPTSQALIPAHQIPLTESEWLTRLESLALSRTKSPEQPRGQPPAKRPVGRPRTKRSSQQPPDAPQPARDDARPEQPPTAPLAITYSWQPQASTTNSQVNSYVQLYQTCSLISRYLFSSFYDPW